MGLNGILLGANMINMGFYADFMRFQGISSNSMGISLESHKILCGFNGDII